MFFTDGAFPRKSLDASIGIVIRHVQRYGESDFITVPVLVLGARVAQTDALSAEAQAMELAAHLATSIRLGRSIAQLLSVGTTKLDHWSVIPELTGTIAFSTAGDLVF